MTNISKHDQEFKWKGAITSGATCLNVNTQLELRRIVKLCCRFSEYYGMMLNA